MEISSSNQAYVFFAMVICGALCTVVFDVFRAVRRFGKASGGIIALQDLIFWIIELVIVCVVAFKLNYAKVRGYEVIALFMGSFIYFISLSEYVIRVVHWVISYLVKLFGVVVTPFVKFAKIASKPFKKFYGVIRNNFVSFKLKLLIIRKDLFKKIRGVFFRMYSCVTRDKNKENSN